MVKNKLGLIEISGQKIGVVADDESIGNEDSSSSSEDEDGSSNSDSIDLTCREPPLGAQESSPETPRAPPPKPGVATCPVFTFLSNKENVFYEQPAYEPIKFLVQRA